MFEAVLTLCALAGQGACRDALLPGFEAATQAECQAALDAQLPDPARFPGWVAQGVPRCVPEGQPLPLTEVAPGIWVHTGLIQEPDTENRGDVSNLAIVIGDSAVAVIDSGGARWIGESLWRAIRSRTDLPVSHVILTHMHPDHVFGATVFEGAEVVAHAKLPRALADRQENYLDSLARLIGPALIGTEVPRVTRPVDDVTQIDLGGRVLRLTAHPAAHTGTDLTVLDIATGTLIAGDLVFHDHTPALDGSLRGWQAVLSGLDTGDIQQVVPGHGAASLPWPEGGADLMRYLDTLARDTRAALDAGERLGDAVQHIAEAERPHWRLFDTYNPRNATVAFTELEWE